VNTPPEGSAEALAAFAGELRPAAEGGALMLDAAKGVDAQDLLPLAEVDGRSDARFRSIDGVSNLAHLCGLGAVVCAEAVRPLAGLTVAIENFDDTGVSVARAVQARGASIVAVSTEAGAAMNAEGFDVDALVAAFGADGASMVASLTDEALPFWRILGATCDVLFAGSKAGLVDHKGAPNVKATLVVPTGAIPYTTKAAIMLERQGSTLLPDFVTTAGATFASLVPGLDDQSELESTVTARLTDVTKQITGKANTAILEGCHLAEAFLRTWRDELPFGRPFAP
jgi:glutamate dehydrogenase/leucine dehydrogenase